MNKKISIALTFLCSIFAAAAVAQEPCATCGLAERGDRVEGIEDREQVSGGSFELLSVHYLTPGEAAAQGSDIHVYFWLPEAGELDELKVWQPARYYRMEPLEKQFGEGLRQYSWGRTEVIDPMGLAVDSLYARVRQGDTYFPALLTTGEPATQPAGVAFVFESSAGYDADCTVARQDGAAVKSFECFEDYGGMITIEWDGKDGAGLPAADGIYQLRIEGDMLAETIRPLDHAVTFRHRASLR